MRPGPAWIAFACVAFALSACGASSSSSDSQLPLAVEHCLFIGGPEGQQGTLPITASAEGTLRIAVEQQGISVVTALMEENRAVTAPAVSPVERLGVITNVVESGPERPLVLRIQSRDSPTIVGRVCVSTDLVHATDHMRLRAERAFFRAGQAVHTRDWDTAFHNYLTAARAFDSLGERQWAAKARHALAELAYWRFHRERDSFALASAALAHTEPSDAANRAALIGLQAMALLELPDVYQPEGVPRVRKLFNESARLFRSASLEAREQPRLRILEGYLEYQSGDAEEADKRFSQAAESCRALRDWDCYAAARQNMAVLAEEQHHWILALEAYEDALRPLDASIAPETVATVSDNIGRLEGKVGLFGRSERSRKKAMRLYARLGECSGARRALSSLGRLLVQVGSVADARIYLSQAVSLSCSDLLSRLRTGAAFEPESVAGQTAAPCEHSANPGELSMDGKNAVFQAYASLIDVLLLEGETAQAKQCISVAQTYVAGNPRSQVEVANASGTVLLDQGQAALARAPFTQALRFADDADLPPTYDQRGIAFLGLARSALQLGETDAARRAANQALRMSSARADVSQIVASLQLLAAAAREANDIDAATHTLSAAVRLIEQVPIDELDGEKRATYLATQHAAFAELTELLILQSAQVKEAAWSAFEISEQGRARSLRHAVNQTARDAASELSDRASEDFRSLLTHIAAVAEHDGSAEALSRQLEQLSRPGAAVEKKEFQQLDRTQLLEQLNRLNASLVEYVIGRQDMFAFVIDNGELHVARLGSRDAIAQAAADLTRYLRAPEVVPRRVQAAARELASRVLWPLSEYITKERIIFVPDDALHTVPFAVLPWSAEEPDKLVVHKAETVLVPSALLIANPRPTSRARNESRFALIGDPIFRAAEWRRECVQQSLTSLRHSAIATSRSIADWAQLLPRLPGTRSEVLAIAGLLRRSHPDSRVQTDLGCTATPNALRVAAQSGSALLHIATHGRVDAQRPRLSALALTPDTRATDSAAFGLLDILGLKLQSRLVVLSACDTSRGQLLPGEGVLGLAQAFLQAGADSVVASHWRIEDDITATFMQRFYRYLLTEREPAATALRHAQLEQMENDHAHNWVAFSLYGWPDSLL